MGRYKCTNRESHFAHQVFLPGFFGMAERDPALDTPLSGWTNYYKMLPNPDAWHKTFKKTSHPPMSWRRTLVRRMFPVPTDGVEDSMATEAISSSGDTSTLVRKQTKYGL